MEEIAIIHAVTHHALGVDGVQEETDAAHNNRIITSMGRSAFGRAA